MKRSQYLELYGHLYTFIPGRKSDNGWLECVYCGDPADTRDHCPPITRVSDYRSLNLENESYILVSCCGECNGLLADSLQESIFERIDEAKKRLARKKKRLLKAPEWSEDELKALKGRLRQDVAGHIRQKRLISHRLSYNGFDVITQSS